MFGLKRKTKTNVVATGKARYVIKITKNSNRAAKRGLWGFKLINGARKWMDCYSRTFIRMGGGEPAPTLDLHTKHTSKYSPHVGVKQLRKQKAKAAKLALVN
jgi:hypothetical protein